MPKKELFALREVMRSRGLSGYYIPGTDPHQSEYVPACWQRRAFVSGFDGSAGDLAVALTKAGLWTDSRYFLQAERQLEDSGIELMKLGVGGTPPLFEWLAGAVSKGEKVGVDPRLVSDSAFSALAQACEARGVELESIQENIVDQTWSERPALPLVPVVPWPLRYAGKSVADKIEAVRAGLAEQGVVAHVVTALDAVAWLLNIRSRDVEYNPVAISYAIITLDTLELFVVRSKVDDELRKHLDGVTIRDYDEVGGALEALGKKGGPVLVEPGASRWVAQKLGAAALRWGRSPIDMLKATKNETEIAGMRSAHQRDAVAMVRFLCWLDKAVPKGGVSEMSASAMLERLRQEQELYQGPSFSPISAYAANAAIVHYSATMDTNRELLPSGLYLIDSGGQYLDGTTDITRTVTLGRPTAEHKQMFTRVLKGHIALASTPFPQGTVGKQLDTLARAALWQVGCNYGHGTGHGVGTYLNVHEGPHAISYYRCTGVPLVPGMMTSNEPGYYKAGDYGIRIENLAVVVESKAHSREGTRFFQLEDLTLCPMDRRLIDTTLLDAREVAHLNAYHARVREVVGPRLESESKTWLEIATEPL
jgi:Xaa-Pro aminopeptidase